MGSVKKIMKVKIKLTINIHLGLSPWYRGSATLFWPSYNLEPRKTELLFIKLIKTLIWTNSSSKRSKIKENMGVVDLSIAAQ